MFPIIGGPKVTVNMNRIVTVSWSSELYGNTLDCDFRVYVMVESDGRRKQLCYQKPSSLKTIYSCKLDLGDEIYCNKVKC